MDFKLSALALVRQDNGLPNHYSANLPIVANKDSFSDLLQGSVEVSPFQGSASITASIDKPIELSQSLDSKSIESESKHNEFSIQPDEKREVKEESKSSDLNQAYASESSQQKEKSDLDTDGIQEKSNSELDKKNTTEIKSEQGQKVTDNKPKSSHTIDSKLNEPSFNHQVQFQAELTKSLGVSGSVKISTADLIHSTLKTKEAPNQNDKSSKSKGRKTLDSLANAQFIGGKSGIIGETIQTAIGGKLASNLDSKEQLAAHKGKAKIHDTKKPANIVTDKKSNLTSTDNSNQTQAAINAAISSKEESTHSQQTKDKLGLSTDKWSIASVKSSRVSTKSDTSTSNSKSENNNQNETQFKNDVASKTEMHRSFDKLVSSSELEKGVRQGFQDLIRKANVQIGIEGNASAQIRMNPDHLGFMSVDMKVEQNRVILKILVDRQDVLDQLKKDIEILRGEFVKTGLQVDSISLKLREPFETSFNSNSSNSDQTHANDFGSSPDNQESNQSFYNDESYFESTQPKILESVQQESAEIELMPRLSRSHYENQLVMNLQNGKVRSSFTA